MSNTKIDFRNVSYTVVRSLETPSAKFQLCSDDIVRVVFKQNAVIDIPEQNENLKASTQITGGKKHPFMYKTENYVIFTKEARERAPKLELESPVIASALVYESFASRLMANFYISIHKPKLPTKSFSNEQEAVKWMKRFLK